MDDRFLGRDRPMGQARVLWEIGPEGADLRALRARLGLDSGYLSRLIRSLEEDGMVTTAPSPQDRRIRRAELTAAGLAERGVLDDRSDELARTVLEPLTDTPARPTCVERHEHRRAAADGERRRDPRASTPPTPTPSAASTAYREELERRTGRDPATSLPVPGRVDPAAPRPEPGRLPGGRAAIGSGALKGGAVPGDQAPVGLGRRPAGWASGAG